ncbi:transposase [Streptomyces sp. NPDC004528]|uniref:transposase n=1 Tax=Streptomyces sp. NPDC004528 TaxID=3154550 RepID=UPI0033A5E13D
MAQDDAAEGLTWVVSVDSTLVWAHQYAAGARKQAADGNSAGHVTGRSWGGLIIKIHLAADACYRPVGFVLTAGQTGDAPAFAEVTGRLRVPRRRRRPLPSRTWSSPTRRRRTYQVPPSQPDPERQ